MHLRDYVKAALRTENTDFPAIILRLSAPRTLRIIHAAFGYADEVGEVFGMLKKHVFYGKPIDDVNLVEEVGDLMWYTALLVDALGVDPVRVLEANVAKLKARFPDRYTDEAAIHRNTDAERAVLEREAK